VIAICALTLVVVGITTAVQMVRLGRLVVEDAAEQAELLAREVYALAHEALARPGIADPAAALAAEPALGGLLDAHLAYSDELAYALIVGRDGEVLVRRPADAEPGDNPEIRTLVELDPFHRLAALYGGGGLYEVRLPLTLDDRPFATIRMGISTSLVEAELDAALVDSLEVAAVALVLSLAAALGLARLTLRPLARLRGQIGRLRRGELELEPDGKLGGDFQDLAAELTLLGREIKSQRLELLGKNASLETVVNQLQDGVVLLNREAEVLFFNPACVAVFGEPLEEALGREIGELLAADHPLLAVVERAETSGEPVEHVRLELPSEERFSHSLVCAFPVVDPDTDAGGLVVLLEDLRTVETLQALVRFGARMASTSRLTASAVHEIKNPLHAINMHLDLLRQRLGEPPPGAGDSLAALGRAIGTLDRRVRDFLDASRPEELRLEAIDLGALLGELIGEARAEAGERGVTIELELPEPEVRIDGDPGRLEQVFGNVVRNAFEAMPDGGALRVSLVRDGGLMVRVTFADDGAGIAPDHLERIFDLFYTTRRDGHGLGLFMVHRIVRAHGGMVTAESEPGRGTRIVVQLPVQGVLQPGGDTGGGSAGRTLHVVAL
jgi:signal transduction histidine kinase